MYANPPQRSELMSISPDWIDDTHLSHDEIAEDIDERRQLAWAVLILLMAGIVTAAINVFTLYFS